MDWQHFINQPIPSQLAKGKTRYWYDLFNEIAFQKFWDETEAQHAADLALDAISANQFAKLGSFDAARNPEGFLRVVYTRAVIDAHQILYGKCQPIKAVRDLGKPFITLFRELCCRHKEAATIAQQQATDEWPESTIHSMLKTIKRLDRNCGRRSGPAPAPTPTEDSTARDFFAEQPDPGHLSTFEGTHYEAVLSALSLMIQPAGSAAPTGMTALGDKLASEHQRIVQSLALTPDERLILQSHFWYGSSLSDIARLHRLPYTKVRNLLLSGLEKARTAFLEAGLDSNDFQMP